MLALEKVRVVNTKNPDSSSDYLIQCAITVAMVAVALLLGDFIHPWETKVSLSVLKAGQTAPIVFKISGVWLVLGAVSMSYLLFGWRVLPAVFFGFHLSALYVFGWSIDPFVYFSSSGSKGAHAITNHVHGIVTTIGPLAAIYTMRIFRLSRFFEGEKLIFQHVIFLMILASFYNTFSKFFIDTTVRTWLDLPIRIDQATYVPSMLVGDLTGGIGFVFIIALIVVPVIRFVVPKAIIEEK